MIDSTLKISHNNPGNNIKLVSYINGNCSVCIADFDKWRPLLNEIKSFQNTEILFYVYSINFNELIKNIERRDQFPITLINDTENLFFQTNNLDENKMYHTFLLDSKNHVVLVGNPMLNSELQDLYIKTIKNLTEKR